MFVLNTLLILQLKSRLIENNGHALYLKKKVAVDFNRANLKIVIYLNGILRFILLMPSDCVLYFQVVISMESPRYVDIKILQEA